MRLLVRDLLYATRGSFVSGYPIDEGGPFSIDTRTLRPGEIFFALRGPRYDGHDFLHAAVLRGAKVLVVDRLDARLPVGVRQAPAVVHVEESLQALQDAARAVRRRAKATVIGITGSNGKTTTKEMVHSILKRAAPTLATRGNLNNHIGLPLTIGALETFHRFAVIEMGTSQKGDMELLIDLARPEVGLITNVGKDHLEFLGTPEGVLAVNQGLFERLPKGGTALINLDDPLLKAFAGRLSCRTLTYGLAKEAQIRARDVRVFPLPVQFTLCIEKKSAPVALSAGGPLQVANALAAAAVAHALGISIDVIVAGLQSFEPAAMRLETVRRADGVVLVNDAYNANPSSMRASVESFCASYPDRAKWVVLGDMRELGAQAKQEHEELGRWLATLPLERIYLYGRDARHIESAALAAGAAGVERFRKKRYLIDALRLSLPAQKPAMLFKASRRMRLEEVIAGLRSAEDGAAIKRT